MQLKFDKGWFYGYLTLETSLHYFPCVRTSFLNILAFFNGGIPSRNGYEFISEHGLLHFAFLTNQLDNYQAKWRLEYFNYPLWHFNYHPHTGDDF